VLLIDLVLWPAIAVMTLAAAFAGASWLMESALKLLNTDVCITMQCIL
jgi:hypothetical protein